jgi:hypothetical protein
MAVMTKENKISNQPVLNWKKWKEEEKQKTDVISNSQSSLLFISLKYIIFSIIITTLLSKMLTESWFFNLNLNHRKVNIKLIN